MKRKLMNPARSTLSSVFNRRDFMIALTRLFGMALAIGIPRRGHAQQADMPFMLGPLARVSTEKGGDELVNPPEADTANEVNLNLSLKLYKIGNQDVELRSYGGPGGIGPTLRYSRTGTAEITVDNQLEGDDVVRPGDHNIPNGHNRTNLHVHGWHVSPDEDNIYWEILPRKSRAYTYHLEDHSPGTFWYHPHRHGSTAIQVAGGLAGALIVEDAMDQKWRAIGIEEKILIINQPMYVVGDDKVGRLPDFDTFWEIIGNPPAGTTINGQIKPKITMKRGQVQRWRLINAAFSAKLGMQFDDRIKEVKQFAVDGLQFDGYRDVREIHMGPGNRSDILVKAPKEAGTYQIRLVPYDQMKEYSFADGSSAPSLLSYDSLATIEVVGGSAPVSKFPKLPSPRGLPVLDDRVEVPTHDVYFQVKGNGGQQEPSYKNRDFTVGSGKDENQLKFDPERIDQEAKLDTTEQWNLAAGGDHPFHIHINPFLVTEVNGKKLDPPQWRDTAIVNKKGLVMRTKYERYAGKTVLHCHILHHEDLGMMQNVSIG